MDKYLVTTGIKFTDIDGFAGILAYTELLKLQGFNDVIAYLPGKTNFTCPAEFLEKSAGLYVTSKPDDYLQRKVILIDISEYARTDLTIPIDTIVEVIDHHLTYEQFWQDRIGNKSDIEIIGSAATIVWRRIKEAGLEAKFSRDMLIWLYTAIISNSLYLNAEVTQEEDRNAYNELRKLANLDDNYDENYYARVENEFFKDIEENLENDAKIEERPGFTYKIIQIELWKESGFIKKYKSAIDKVLKAGGYRYSFLIIPCISEKQDYIYTPDKETQQVLKKAVGWFFGHDNIAKTDKLILRKQIIKLI